MMHPAEQPDTANHVRARTELGDFELTVLSDGTYFLDGGAMFGVVPKPLWEKRAPADKQNRILLGLNTVVVRTGKHTVVIETGVGNKLSDKLREIYGAKEQLPRAFEAAGIRPEEIDIVVNSHLHFDHGTLRVLRTVASFRHSQTPATSRIAAKSTMATCSWSAMPSATSAKIMIPWPRAGR
jgi:Metallo-beta-lactamase superfamily